MEYCWIISGVMSIAAIILMILVIILFRGYKRLKKKVPQETGSKNNNITGPDNLAKENMESINNPD